MFSVLNVLSVLSLPTTGKFWKSDFFLLVLSSSVPKTGKFWKSIFSLLAWCSGVPVFRQLVNFDRPTPPIVVVVLVTNLFHWLSTNFL